MEKRKKQLLLMFNLCVVFLFAGCFSAGRIPQKKDGSQEKSHFSEKVIRQNQQLYKGTIRLTGAVTLWELTVKKETSLVTNYTINNHQGDLSLYLSDNNYFNQSIVTLENKETKEKEQEEVQLKEGTYYVKLKGSKSNATVDLELLLNQEIDVKIIDQLHEEREEADSF